MKLLNYAFFALSLFGSVVGLNAQPYDTYDDESLYDYYTPGVVGGTVSDAGRAVEDVGGIIGNVI